MTQVTCRLTAENRDQLQNRTLGNRVRATFTFLQRTNDGDDAKVTEISHKPRHKHVAVSRRSAQADLALTIVCQSCPWVGLTHGLAWVGSIFFSCWCISSTIAKVLKIWKDYQYFILQVTMSALFVMQMKLCPSVNFLYIEMLLSWKTYRNSTVSTWLLVTWLGTVAKMNCMNYLIFCNLRLQLCISCIC